jgi:GT2 family glycosyltransferase
MSDPLVDVIVVGWDNFELTRRCLNSVQQGSVPALQITYVDNGSRAAGLIDFLRDYPRVNIIALPTNHGFVRGVNLGLACALFSKAPYVLLLNNDAWVPEGDTTWLERMVSHFHDETVGAVGAVTDRVFGFQRRPKPDGRPVDVLTEVPVLIAFALMIRKSAFQQVGFFDERFTPGNYEDFDYSVRLRRAGYKLVVAESVWLHHEMHATLDKLNVPLDALLENNRQKFVEKWGADVLHEMGIAV